jgi:hypothetical protein
MSRTYLLMHIEKGNFGTVKPIFRHCAELEKLVGKLEYTRFKTNIEILLRNGLGGVCCLFSCFSPKKRLKGNISYINEHIISVKNKDWKHLGINFTVSVSVPKCGKPIYNIYASISDEAHFIQIRI